jgi:hypothetical protein
VYFISELPAKSPERDFAFTQKLVICISLSA